MKLIVQGEMTYKSRIVAFAAYKGLLIEFKVLIWPKKFKNSNYFRLLKNY